MKKKFKEKLIEVKKEEAPLINPNPVKASKTFDFYLLARSMFDKYKRGDRIENAGDIERILGGHQKNMVVKVKK